MSLTSVRRLGGCIGLLLLTMVGLGAQEVRYIYDELGRLIGLIKTATRPSTSTTRSGIMSITRQSVRSTAGQNGQQRDDAFLYDALNPVQELSAGPPTANLLTRHRRVFHAYRRSRARGTI